MRPGNSLCGSFFPVGIANRQTFGSRTHWLHSSPIGIFREKRAFFGLGNKIHRPETLGELAGPHGGFFGVLAFGQRGKGNGGEHAIRVQRLSAEKLCQSLAKP